MSLEDKKTTPAQKQYNQIKAQYKDCILFFRMWDFYETFDDDAKICSKVLDLTLTSRDRNSDDPTPMAGVPYHSVDKYIAKLVNHGYKVAIAEQISDPKPWQIVERKVTQVITPATFIEESKKEFVYMAAVSYTGGDVDSYHCARWDVTVGSYHTRSFRTLEMLLQWFSHIQPREVVVDIDFPETQQLREFFQSQSQETLITIYDQPVDTNQFLCTILKVQTLASFWKALEEWRQTAMSLLLNYVVHIQNTENIWLLRVQYSSQTTDVALDSVTIRNLEIVSSQYEWTRKYSLLGVLDTTASALGARLFREILLHPTGELSTIHNRHKRIEKYVTNQDQAKSLHGVLRQMVDMPKIIATLLYKKNTPTTYWKLRYALSLIVTDWKKDADGDTTIIWTWAVFAALWEWLVASDSLQTAKDFLQYLHSLLKYEWLNDDIDYIQDWYDAQIDELRKIAYHSDGLLIAYQQELVQATGIANIKVKYISNQWYVLEVTPKDVDAFESQSIKWDEKREMIRRQTLKTGQRYTSVYLDELQRKVLSAQFQLRSREQELLEEAKAKLLSTMAAFQEIADWIARLDVYTSHALFVKENKYIKPDMIDLKQSKSESGTIKTTAGEFFIEDGRHPVIEAFLPHDQEFIPNDLFASKEDEPTVLAIITWPNMWWKSTYLRQNALIILLAHCGLYVPAKQAHIPLVDWIFARVGSGDVLAKNQSTFMTEMIEMANILHNATKDSFIILDELGRGTSTYDGMALAQAIVQYIVQHIGAKTLFATHYHELIALEWSLPWVKNYSVSVYETQKDVVFMKKIVEWWADKSYGIDVAKLAWIPSVITEAARKYLQVYENKQTQKSSETNISWWDLPESMPLFAMHIDHDSIDAKNTLEKVKRLLASLDPNNMTPMQALQMIARLKSDIEK